MKTDTSKYNLALTRERDLYDHMMNEVLGRAA